MCRRLRKAVAVLSIVAGLVVPSALARDVGPKQYAKALQSAIRKDIRTRPADKIKNVVVRPGKREQGVQLYDLWIAYTHNGKPMVEYFVITPDGTILDEAFVRTVGDHGNVLA